MCTTPLQSPSVRRPAVSLRIVLSRGGAFADLSAIRAYGRFGHENGPASTEDADESTDTICTAATMGPSDRHSR